MDREYHRIEAVKRFKDLELDPAITNDLNDIIELAAQICDTPVALITLLDGDTQWFKAARGTGLTQTPRNVSFCNHTILQDGVLVIADTVADEVHSKNPLVTDAPNIRFYAGAPLNTKDGFGIGSLCVLDFKAKEITDHQQKSLKVLSKQVMNLLELNYSLQVMAEQNHQTREQQIAIVDSKMKLKAFFDSTTDIHILVGREMDVLAFNKPAEVYIYNIHRHKLEVGDRLLNFVDPKVKSHFTKYLSICLAGKVIKHELLLRAGTEFEQWREIKLVPIKNQENEIIGVAINSADISKRKQQEKQINIQNEALTRIAIIQSHELRRPVASLMGLMNLMKLEDIDFGYFSMMELTVNELDEKIRLIVEDSEKTISAPMSIVA